MAAVRHCRLPAAGWSPAAAKLGGFVRLNATDLRRFHHVAMCRRRRCCCSAEAVVTVMRMMLVRY